jgi:histidinol-phosphate/aromatic aminotransferase/cobyric acid decarboxylase-like protein
MRSEPAAPAAKASATPAAPVTPAGAAARVHGGPVAEELRALGVAAGEILDFSVNLNPYGPAPAMLEAIRGARVDEYPDPTARPARQALAAANGLTAERIVLGNGGAELLWTLARVLVAPGRTAVTVEPTFSEFGAAVTAGHGAVVAWRAGPERGFAVDLPAVAATARGCAAAALYLCAPNNPTGRMVGADEIAALARRLPEVTLIIDQSFLSLDEHHAQAAAALPENVVRVRSLTKEHAIPGVRVGYLVAAPAIAAAVEMARPAWTTGAAAQAAALASCHLTAFVAESRQRLVADRRALDAGLRELGLSPVPSSAPFCVVRTSHADEAGAAPLRRALLSRHGILVRDCASFGMPGYLRLGARPAADRRRLLGALRAERPRC